MLLPLVMALGSRIPVLHYSDRFVAVNKPAGISVHRNKDTGRRRVVTTQLQRQFRRKEEPRCTLCIAAPATGRPHQIRRHAQHLSMPVIGDSSTATPGSAPPVGEIAKVGVVGMGLMGHGIAQISAAAGTAVIGVDLNAEVLASGRRAIETSVGKLNARKAKKDPAFDADAAVAATLANLSSRTTSASTACHSILAGWAADYPEEQAFAVPPSLAKKVAENKLGRKNGEGYYVGPTARARVDEAHGVSADPLIDERRRGGLGRGRRGGCGIEA
ncbi:3-hydroxyacyl-CoA dehydrogenase [Aureococcus anophagefferens]|uniref:3-hydroxyacyl-CoA dehydrogenase n=1 Tax=Aureococcus anophagefferens TaxID=44056 RepID=A0ABR1G1Z8_AURAN